LNGNIKQKVVLQLAKEIVVVIEDIRATNIH
jgi:hypothetical protein